MNVPSLQRLTVLSIVFHITFFGMVFLALKQSSRLIMPSPYVVSLVESEITSEKTGAQAVSKNAEPEVVKPVSKKEEMVSASRKEVDKLSKKEERQLEERIAAMEAKKKIKHMAELRKKMDKIVPLKASAIGGGKAGSSKTAAGKGDNSVVGDYESKVKSRIWDKWGVPREMKEKKLEAIVSIRIMRDGSVQIIGIEQKSGNTVFDRSVLVAIRDASPLPPPPYEMEIGVRFYP